MARGDPVEFVRQVATGLQRCGNEIILSQRQSSSVDMLLDISTDNQNSQGVWLGGRPILGLLMAGCNGTPDVTFKLSLDEGAHWYELLEDDGATAAITIAAGATAFFVSSDDLSQLAGYVGTADGVKVLVRAVFSVAQTADRTLTWLLVA